MKDEERIIYRIAYGDLHISEGTFHALLNGNLPEEKQAELVTLAHEITEFVQQENNVQQDLKSRINETVCDVTKRKRVADINDELRELKKQERKINKKKDASICFAGLNFVAGLYGVGTLMMSLNLAIYVLIGIIPSALTILGFALAPILIWKRLHAKKLDTVTEKQSELLTERFELISGKDYGQVCEVAGRKAAERQAEYINSNIRVQTLSNYSDLEW